MRLYKGIHRGWSVVRCVVSRGATDWTLPILGRSEQTRSRAVSQLLFSLRCTWSRAHLSARWDSPHQEIKNQGVLWGNLISYVDYTLRIGCQCDSGLTRSLVLVRQMVLPTEPPVWWRLIGVCVYIYPEIKVVFGCSDQDAERIA